MKSILATVKDDVIAFIESNSELFFNERDFQMHLAVYLRGLNKYDDVDVEYYIPHSELETIYGRMNYVLILLSVMAMSLCQLS